MDTQNDILAIQDLLKLGLKLPSYQRPYRWGVKTALTLFNDTYQAFKNNQEEYRLGTVILHQSNGVYFVVDGQQRLTTLSILLYCLGKKDEHGHLKEEDVVHVDSLLLNEPFGPLSQQAVWQNFQLLAKRVRNLLPAEREQYKKYLLTQCDMVKIIAASEQESFQFFDSQNNRGASLAPHDLLKSYHLREMRNLPKEEIQKWVNQWEDINQKYLEVLFKNYLYPLTRWYKKENGLGYNSLKIDAFKGVRVWDKYTYSNYHKASHLFAEEYNAGGYALINGGEEIYPFQLTQPVIDGKRFFAYVLHYNRLLREIQKKIQNVFPPDCLPEQRAGDRYVKCLFECAVLFFADRFGLENVTAGVMHQCYTWSYSLRVKMSRVYRETINKYALGIHPGWDNGALFQKISGMKNSQEIEWMELKRLDQPGETEETEEEKSKYDAIKKKLNEINGWNI